MNAAKATYLWLAFIFACLLPACAHATFTVQGSLAGAGANGSAAAAADTFHAYVPPLSESLGYDASGNRGSDSHWSETWNALDQLTTVIESNPYSTATSTRLDCVYDVSGRRVQKQVSVGGQVTKRTTTLWDGWLPMMEIDYGASGLESARRYYTWGPDVSGSLDGAAGIGGLIEIYEIKPTAATRSLPVQDGIGNVVGLVDETTGQSVATYQYGPFGEVVGVYGPRAESCPLRYQTKLYDEETGFYYFGKRYYDPKTQTWLSRDPERESGGINLYAYCGNDPVGQCDPLGLAMFGYFDSYSEYFSEVGQTYANIGLGAYQAVKGAGLGTIQLIGQTPTNLFQIGSSLAKMSQDPKLYLSAAYDLIDESHPISDAEQGLLSLGQQTADLWTSGDLAQQGQFVGGVLGNAALLAAPFAKLPAVGDIYATVKSAYTGNSRLSTIPGISYAGTLDAADTGRGISAYGNPLEIALNGGSLNARQASLLSQLEGYGAQIIVPKSMVVIADLSALTAETGNEFALFTRGSQRLLMQGNSTSVPIYADDATQLAMDGWKWSAHTHPGISSGILMESSGDISILRAFQAATGQKQSLILNSAGQWKLFTTDMSGWLPR